MALCLGLAGCGTFGFGKKSPKAGPAPGPPAPGSAPVPGRPGIPPPPDQPAAAGSPFSGILAGQVIDSFNRRPPVTSIKVVQVKDKDGKDHAPIELEPVWTDTNGYFLIQKLQPGRHYQLIAVAKDGERKLAGTTYATPPDPRVLIRISEDFVTPQTPDIPASPGAPRPDKPTETSQGPPATNWPESPAIAGGPPGVAGFGVTGPPGASGGPLRGAAELGQPVPRGGAAPRGTTPPPVVPHRENIAVGDGRTRPPTTSIPGGPPPAGRPATGSPAPVVPPPVSTAPTPSAPVPFCVLTGRKLDNFALNDLNGQPWEYRKNRRGKLVLLDFWQTKCTPCLHAIPHLNGWQQTYGPYGLEVVGIAYETGSHEEKVRRIRSLRYSPSYTVLLGTSPAERCPVKNQFQALYFPTLVLLDETGQIVWRGEGLDAQQLRELEIEIKRRLGLR